MLITINNEDILLIQFFLKDSCNFFEIILEFIQINTILFPSRYSFENSGKKLDKILFHY